MSFDFDFVTDILRGRYQKIPELRKKEVRIFISSTFTGKNFLRSNLNNFLFFAFLCNTINKKDTMAERDYLIERIFPKLKEYCKRKYDLDFQVIKKKNQFTLNLTKN